MSNAHQNLTPGTQVEIVLPADHPTLTAAWWPTDTVTGTVEKVYKNGKVAVAVDRVHNQSADRLKTLHFLASELVAK